MTERRDDVLMLASLEEPAVYVPEIAVPDEIVDRFLTQEVEGLDDPEALEMFRLALKRFKRLHEEELKRKLRAIRRGGARAYVYWERRALGKHTGGVLTYIATATDAQDTNIKTPGKLPNFMVKAIGVGFDVVKLTEDDMDALNSVISKGRFKIRKGDTTVIDVPLSMVADWTFTPAVDGNTSPVSFYVNRNNKLERGLLPVKGIYFGQDDTVEVVVEGLNDVPASSTIPTTVILAGYITK